MLRCIASVVMPAQDIAPERMPGEDENKNAGVRCITGVSVREKSCAYLPLSLTLSNLSNSTL